jgi:carboxypeptidase-like protein/TonB-dependent receptor-like protein
MSTIASVLLLFGISQPVLLAQANDSAAVVRGKVLDFKTREAIARALVSIREQGIEATTAADGTFELSNVRPGTVELSVTTVGYGLSRKRIELAAGSTVELEFLLDQEALRHTEDITVSAGPFAPVEPAAAMQYTLNNTEIRNLSTILADDPLRAVQNLPGVTANQDFYSEFAVRGAGPAHVGVFIDGVLVDRPFHGGEDQGELGSLSIINGDIVESIALMSGAFPPKYGDRTAAVLALETRDGGRDRVSARINANVLGASAVAEGPLGSSKKASWLVSVRKSYLEYLLSRLETTVALGYQDLAGKLTYDLSGHHRLSLTAIWGGSQATRHPIKSFGEQEGFSTRGHAGSDLATLRWNWIVSPTTLLQTQAFWTRGSEHDRNPTGRLLLDDTATQTGIRAGLTHQFATSNVFEVGLSVRRVGEHYQRESLWDYRLGAISAHPVPVADFAKAAWQPGGYAQASQTLLHARLKLQLGGRWDGLNVTGQNVWRPYASATFSLRPKTSGSVSFGEYAQFPSLQELYGEFGSPGLRAERATHATVSLEHLLTDRVRLRAEFYNRRERGVIYSPLAEFRAIRPGVYATPQLGPILGNLLDGYSRGFEISLQRRSANRLSGWISYARGYTRYWQDGTSLAFWGDFDERDTATAYGTYRLKPTLNLSASARYGSGFPLPGFLADPSTPDTGDQAFVAFRLVTTRNKVRLPDYERVDLRVSKVFNRDRFRLTVYGEVANVVNHKNWRYYNLVVPPFFQNAGQVYQTRNTIMPILPTAGLTLEF